MIVVDGAYVFMGARDLITKTQRKLKLLNPEKLKIMKEFIQTKINRKISEAHWITAEDNIETAMYHKNLYETIVKNGFKLDIRDFKRKKAYCPNKDCQHNKGFDTKVQREVDVAIAMRPVKSLYENPNLDVVVLLAGDGDFLDMVEFFTQTLRKKVYVVAWSASIGIYLKEKCTDVFYLDAIWDDLTEATDGAPLTNSEVLKLIGISDTIAYAATRKYPSIEQRDECIEFALKLN